MRLPCGVSVCTSSMSKCKLLAVGGVVSMILMFLILLLLLLLPLVLTMMPICCCYRRGLDIQSVPWLCDHDSSSSSDDNIALVTSKSKFCFHEEEGVCCY